MVGSDAASQDRLFLASPVSSHADSLDATCVICAKTAIGKGDAGKMRTGRGYVVMDHDDSIPEFLPSQQPRRDEGFLHLLARPNPSIELTALVASRTGDGGQLHLQHTTMFDVISVQVSE